jgi:type I restriction enzyme R subunit
MTTGYDCEDILNLCLMRPIFSPTDFIQIKGRGTRTYEFTKDLHDPELKSQIVSSKKINYKLFDFFANCEYFEEKYNYDEILKLPRRSEMGSGPGGGGEGPTGVIEGYERFDPDALKFLQEQQIGLEGMKIDRMFFEKFEERIKEDEFIKTNVQEGNGRYSRMLPRILNKPEEFFTLINFAKPQALTALLLRDR